MKKIAALFCSVSISLFTFVNANAQLTDFDFVKKKTWTANFKDKNGKLKTVKAEGKIVSLDRQKSSVVLLLEEDKKAKRPAGEKTIELAALVQKDQVWINDLEKSLPRKIESRASNCVLPKDAEDMYQKYLNSGFVPPENELRVNGKINQFKQFANGNCIQLKGEFLTPEQLEDRKKESDKIVTKWVSDANAKLVNDTSELADTSKFDPTSIGAAILEALCVEVLYYELETSSNNLEEAVKRGTKYMAIADSTDFLNLVAAKNNLGVSYARQNKVSKAVKAWQEIDSPNVPAALKHNVDRTLQMILSRKGLSIKQKKTLKELRALHSNIQAVGGAGGWELICPVDNAGLQRVNLDFLGASSFARVVAASGMVTDTRCVTCAGTDVMTCNGRCGGKGFWLVPGPPEEFTIPGSGGVKARRPTKKQVKCPVCGGKGRITCINCVKGSQSK
jgi:hypothetical protein